MDVLTLKPFNKKAGNITHAFLEFCINNTPLSLLLDNYNTDGYSLLLNYTGVLGSEVFARGEWIKLHQLMQKEVTDAEIRKAIPGNFSSKEALQLAKEYLHELKAPEVIIYCCAECGDYYCGGVKVVIDIQETTVTWSVCDMPAPCVFTFDKYQYYRVLKDRMSKLAGNRRS